MAEKIKFTLSPEEIKKLTQIQKALLSKKKYLLMGM